MARWRSAGGAVTVVGAVLSTCLAVGQVSVSDASWREDEHVHAGLGTLDCAQATGFATRGAGRLVGGTLLGQDLDSLAVVSGVTATSDGTRSQAAAPAEQVGQDTWANPLAVTALDAVSLSVSGMLDDVLEIGTDNTVGTVNQVGHADAGGTSYGASGVVSDSGVVMLDEQTPDAPPQLGTLRLSRLVEALTGRAVSEVVQGVTDVSLEVGALASRAELDACQQAWDPDAPGTVSRDYAVAGLGAELQSPLVSGLGSLAGTALDGLSATVGGLAQDADVVGDIGSGVSALLAPVLGGLGLGGVSVSGPKVALDLDAVRRLASTTVSDDAGTVRLDLATGAVSVDLASLVGRAYGGQGTAGGAGLNQLAPDTELVLDAAVTTTLVARLGEALDGWVADVVAATRTALLAARVTTTVQITLQGTVQLLLAPPLTLDVARLDTVIDGTLADLLAGRGTVTATVQVLPSPLGVGELVDALVNPLVGGLVNAVTAGAGPVVGRILQGVLLGEDSALGALGSTLSGALAPVVTALSGALTAYLGVDRLVSVVVNAQSFPVPRGQYDVAALTVRVLSALGAGGGLSLELARASVGRSCRPGESVSSDVCAGY